MPNNYGNSIASVVNAYNQVVAINSTTLLSASSYNRTYTINGAYTITLPLLSAGSPTYYLLFMNDTSSSTAVIAAQGSDNIRVAGTNTSTLSLLPGDSVLLENNGSSWSLGTVGFLKANVASPTFTGTPSAPTAAPGTSTTQLATTSFVQTAFNALAIASKMPIVGAMRNGRMGVVAASSTATFTADEIVVQTSLSGSGYLVYSFGKVLNVSTTGAGGMDTGTAPLSGYIAIYAIYNPTTGVANILAQDTTSIVAPEIYGGSSMPSGYTASALVSVWRTNSSRQLVTGSQRDRTIVFASISAFGVSNDVYNSISGTFSVAGLVPMNALCIFGMLSMGASGHTNYGFSFIGVNSVGMSGYDYYSQTPFSDLYFATPQSLTYGVGTGSSPVSVSMNICGYKF